jgi:hypothetical protein
LNFKRLLLGGEKEEGASLPAMAIGASFRIPSGDSLNFLGSGAVGGNVYGLLEYRRRIAPHLKLSYQWNGDSQIVNLEPGAPGRRLAGGLEYSAGTDIMVVPPLTVAVDLLGNQFVNAPSVALHVATFSPLPAAGSGVPSQYYVQSSFDNTYSTLNFSTGLKWKPKPHFIVFGSVQMQLNNVGLRSNPVPLFGIAYNFHRERN